MLPRESIDGVQLSMLRLSEGSEAQVLAACRALADAYQNWINEKELEATADATLSDALRQAANSYIDLCRRCLARIEDGTSLLGVDADVLEVFQLMNRAMNEQMDHYAFSVNARDWIDGGNGLAITDPPYIAPVYSAKTSWRPFQLAFILMNIRAFVDPNPCGSRHG